MCKLENIEVPTEIQIKLHDSDEIIEREEDQISEEEPVAKKPLSLYTIKSMLEGSEYLVLSFEVKF